MAVEITVILDGSAGALARVITALKRFGLTFAGHHIEPVGGDRSRLTVGAEGTALLDALYDELARIKGVAEVVRIDSDGVARLTAPPESPRSAPPRRPAPAADPKARGLEDLAKRLVADYPRIVGHLDAFEQTITSREDLAPRLRRLGKLVGGQLGEQDPTLLAANTLNEALETSVVQVLDRIAEPEVVGSDIRVRLSIFTRRPMSSTEPGGEASRCEFLSGMIEGMIDAVAVLPAVRVDETSCRTRGDEYCTFHISS